MSLTFINQYSKDLRLNLIYEPLKQDRLTILSKKSVNLENGFSLEAAIIGESHYITLFFNGESVFTELLACIDLHKEHQHAQALQIKSSLKHDVKDIFYAISINSYPAQQNILSDFSKTKGILDLSHQFPNKDYEVEAKTHIIIKLINSQLYIQTLHSYPNEGTIVLSNSKVDIQELYLTFKKEAS